MNYIANLFKGRVGRLHYFLGGIFTPFILLGLISLVIKIIFGEESILNNAVIILSAIFYIPLFITLGIRRCHDLNKSGFMFLLQIIPIIGWFFGLYLIFAKGTPGRNKYGEEWPIGSSFIEVILNNKNR